MKIFFDNIETVKNLLGSEVKILDENNEDKIFIAKKIFNQKFYNSTSSNFSDYWKYLFVEEYSSQSQFDTVCDLNSNNNDLPDNFLCLAETGKGFHGFRNRSWETKKGNIHLTIYFKPQNNINNIHPGLLLLGAVAVVKTIDSIPSLRNKAQTKWVNDIVLENSKVCGIITKSFSVGNSLSGAVIGIGLNVNSSPQIERDIFTPSTTSISELAFGAEVNIPSILSNLLKNLKSSIITLNNNGYDELLDFYIERSSVLGKKVAIYSDLSNGKNELIATGIVKKINKNLEIILENYSESIRKGRLSLII